MVFERHSCRKLQELYKNKPYQGQDPDLMTKTGGVL
jgi:hypothetical protein